VIKNSVDAMVEARKVANKIEDAREKAIAYHDTVEPFSTRFVIMWTSSNL